MLFTKTKSRIEMALVGSGKFGFDQAQHQLQDVHAHIVLTEDVAMTTAGQSALLTAVALCARCFGSVSVNTLPGTPYIAKLPIPVETLDDAARALGAISPQNDVTHSIVIGSGTAQASGSMSVRASWQGWTATAAPAEDEPKACEGNLPLTGIAAAALAVGELFQQRLGNPLAGRREQRISLWSPGTAEAGPAPETVVALPRDIWLIGLGNLGQAYLWALSALDYADPGEVSLVLQDFDRVDVENFGTSILTQPDDCEELKTLISEGWCLRRGFTVTRVDRRLDLNTRREDSEPFLALSGLDKVEPRKLLGNCGFQYVIDAGLGANADDFDRIRINTFDASLSPSEHFKGQHDEDEHVRAESAISTVKAYQDAATTVISEKERCGFLGVAGKSVAVPYVSALAACLVVAQTIRLVSGYATHKSICGQAKIPDGFRSSIGTPPTRLLVGSTGSNSAR